MGNSKDAGRESFDFNSIRQVKRRKNHILAIAIDDYTNGPSPLSHPVQECEQLIDLLTARYAFEERHIISKLYNKKATGDILFDELHYLRDKLNGEHNLILIFSGHGYLDEDGHGYWIPVDGPVPEAPSAVRKYLSLDEILRKLAKVKAHHIVLIVDSCFSGRFAQATLELPKVENPQSIDPNEQPSRWVLTSGRHQLVADDSPFAAALYEVLWDNKEESLTLRQLHQAVRQKMRDQTTQIPECDPIVEGDFRGGEFAFRLREALAKRVPASPHAPGDTTELLARLRQGSGEYLEYLKKGRLAKLQFEKILLPDARAELLEVEVELEDQKTPLRQAMEQLWSKDRSHTLLCGEGGMGKTVSCVRLWEELLQAGEEAPVIIYLPLNEFNASTEEERQGRNYLYQFIAREYLDDTRLTPEVEDALKQLFKTSNEQPTAILLLDGFNEITVEKRELMVELAEFVRRAKGVQIAVTSRYEMRQFAWTQGFDRLDLLDLTNNQIQEYLEGHRVPLPENRDVLELLRNPMMLTLYTGASQLAEQFKDDSRITFKEHVTSKGELLQNFIEAQQAKFLLDNMNNPAQQEEFLWQAFLLRHLLPYLAYRMVEEGQFSIAVRKSVDPKFNFKSVIQEAYDYFSSFDFTDFYPAFEGRRSWLDFGIDKQDYDELEERNRRIRSNLTQKLFLLAEEADTLRFLHQNFRDFFAAVHVQRDIELATARNQDQPPEKRKFPVSLQKAPLDFYVRQLLGEIEGEHSNKMEWNEEKKRWQWSRKKFFLENNLAGLLEQCRSVFDENQLGYTVWNLLTIWKEQRGELSGMNVRRLNFQGYSFNGLRTSRPGLPAYLSEGSLREEDLFSQGHSAGVWSVAYSPDGGRLLTGSYDNTAKVWDAQSGQCLLTLEGHSSGVLSVAYSPDGGRLLTGSSDKTAKVWDAQSGQCLLTLEGHSSGVSSVAYSPDGGRLLTGSYDNTAKVWDAQSGQCLLTLEGHSDWVRSVAYSPDGGRLLTGSDDKTAKVWDAQSGQCLLTLEGHSAGVWSVAYSPDGGRLLTGSDDKTAKVWDAQSGQCLLTLEGHSSGVRSVAYSPDGGRLLTGSYDNTAKVWDAQSGQCLLTLEGHSSGVRSVAYSPDGGRLLTGSYDKTAKVWDAQSGQCLLTLEGHSDWVRSVAYSPDGGRLLTGSYDKTAKVWDAQSGQCLLTLEGHSSGVSSVAYSPDGGRLLTGSDDNTAKVWDAQSGQCLLTLEGHSSGVRSVAYSPDGGRLLTGSDDKTAKVWDAQSGQCLLTLEGHSSGVWSVAYSPDGGRLLTGSYDNTAKVWDAQSGQCLLTLEGHSDWVRSVAYSPDGGRLLTGSYDNTAKVWDAQSGQCLLTLEGHSSGVWSVAYSPDGGRLLTGSYDKTAKVWDAQSGQCLLTLEGHSAGVWSVAYSPDGGRLLTGSDDKTAKVWDAQSGQCLLTMPNIPGLFIQGCDFRDLHSSSELSKKSIDLLRQYGGIFDDEDAKRWAQLMEKHFGIKEVW